MQSRLVRWLIVGAGVIGILGIAAVSYAAYRHAHEGDRVQRASDRLSTPAGWKVIGTTEGSGSQFGCIVSCPHPEVTKVFQTDAAPLAACAVIKAQVSREIALPRRDMYDSGCGWRAPLSSVGGRADVGALALKGSDARATFGEEWPGSSPPIDDATYVFVTFSGGPT